MQTQRLEDCKRQYTGECSGLCLGSKEAIRFALVNSSANTLEPLFLQYSFGQIWAPGLKACQMKDWKEDVSGQKVVKHPALELASFARSLDLASDALELVSGFSFWVKRNEVSVPVYLVRVQARESYSLPWGARWVKSVDRVDQDSLEVAFMEKAKAHLRNT